MDTFFHATQGSSFYLSVIYSKNVEGNLSKLEQTKSRAAVYGNECASVLNFEFLTEQTKETR